MIIESMVRYDAKADVLYLVCDEGEIARSIEISPGIAVEFGDAGNILGVEILRAPKSSRKKSLPCSMPNRPGCCKELLGSLAQGYCVGQSRPLLKHRRIYDEIDRVDPIDRDLSQPSVFIDQLGIRGLILAVELAVFL
jgi:uncharacterized protein YuzE